MVNKMLQAGWPLTFECNLKYSWIYVTLGKKKETPKIPTTFTANSAKVP